MMNNADTQRMIALVQQQTGYRVGDTQTRAIVFEIAMLGRSGLDINDAAKKYTLRSLPGEFSGLHLVSLMYTGLKQLEPNADAGIDLSQEFAEAKKLLEKPKQD